MGFPAGITGGELADRAVVQARKFGAVFTIPGEATSSPRPTVITCGACGGDALVAHAVLLATGVHYRRLDIPGADRLEGSSVYYAATEFEARLCRQDPVTVVEEAAPQPGGLLPGRQSPVVNLVIRHDDLGRTCRGTSPTASRSRHTSRSGATAKCASSSATTCSTR